MEKQIIEDVCQELSNVIHSVTEGLDILMGNSQSLTKEKEPDKEKEIGPSEAVNQWLEVKQSGRLEGKALNNIPASKLEDGETNFTGKKLI
jgi:hypothetical protein